MYVLGLDLSLTGTGLVVLDDTGEVVSHHTISTKKIGMERLSIIRTAIAGALSTFSPTLTCIEGYSFSSKQSHCHALGELGGVVRLMLHRNKFAYIDVPPSTLKKFATGKGNAMKDQIMMAVFKRWQWEAPDNNQADAYVLARLAMHLETEDVTGLIGPQLEVIKSLQAKPEKRRAA